MATGPEPVWVLDTSVAIAWLSPDESHHERAVEVRRRIREDPNRYVVPHLFYSELVNVMARKWGFQADHVTAALAYTVRFGLATLALSEQALIRMAEWACRGLGGYDATFVALAEDVGGRWLTADTRAARIADGHAVTLLGWSRIQKRR